MRLLDVGARLRFVSLQEAAVGSAGAALAAIGATHPLAVALHVVGPNGRVESGGRAVLEILSRLPLGFLFRPWALIPGVPQALEVGYRWAADHRPALARLLRIG